MFADIRNLVFGSSLPTAEEVHQRLNKVQALAVFSSDVLSSMAYATEEILLILATAGSAAMVFPLSSYHNTVAGLPGRGRPAQS